MKKETTQEVSSDIAQIIRKITEENPGLKEHLEKSKDSRQLKKYIRSSTEEILKENPAAYKYYLQEEVGREAFEKLRWKDFACIRILEYIDNAGIEIEDKNLHGRCITGDPFDVLFKDFTDRSGGGNYDFYVDMLRLFRQQNDKRSMPTHSREQILEWMAAHPSGLDEEVIEMRKKNRDRIISKIIKKIDSGDISSKKFYFSDNMTPQEKFDLVLRWWEDRKFHLRFAVRDPETLNEMLDNTLSKEIVDILERADKAGIPTFVNPYYLSLINVNVPEKYRHSDDAIRQYILYSDELIEEFGEINAWEMEDVVEPGKPNAAGWLLPTHDSIHRRYPDVAILIPDTVGRACGGLCSSCQRMYDFQSGHLNFNLDKLEPTETWPEKLRRLMKYWEEDSQLRDILITGGDALMSTDTSLKLILDEIYETAKRKKEANKNRPEGEKYAELLRVRLGTRLPVYIPQRITTDLEDLLAEFKMNASRLGVKQFVIQTHFESAMEITPEVVEGVRKLLSAGWIVTNQLVFTSAASKRGHTNKLRQMLNHIGVLTYYTFTVKGYKENKNNFATNARAVQEQLEEKAIGKIPPNLYDKIKEFPMNGQDLVRNINEIKESENIPFLACDRNVLNMPGVGKSQTFSCISITKDGRRILEFDHDDTRRHSPAIKNMPKVLIVESKSMEEYLRQMEQLGEDRSEYSDVFGYSLGETEYRLPLYEYPDYDFKVTDKYTNLGVE